MEAKLRDGDSVTASQSRPASDPDFSKGGVPQYLWVPRVEEDGYKGAKTFTRAKVASTGDMHAIAEAADGMDSGYVHKGAPPEIEFQVGSVPLMQFLTGLTFPRCYIASALHAEC